MQGSSVAVGQTTKPVVDSGRWSVAPAMSRMPRAAAASVEQEAQRGMEYDNLVMQLPRESSNVETMTLLGLGGLVTAAMAVLYRFMNQNKKQVAMDLQPVDWAMATTAGEDVQAGGIPGIAPRPAGYSHDVTKGYQLEEVSRPRRNRRSPVIRSFMRETSMTPANFIAPFFIHDDDFDEEISAMPGCYRLCAASVMREVAEHVAVGVRTFILFPKIPDELKTPDGRQCYDENDIVMRTIKMIKAAHPDVIICTDVALDPYNSDGHDGIVDMNTGEIINDITVEQLCKQAVQQARAGADIVAPSDMQDGRIGAIRDALDNEGFTGVGIMAYTAKYASAFYGPFRTALDSNPSFGDKSTYQMDPANSREALREIELDEAEGADVLMVKPGLPYLDVIAILKQNSSLPIAAYHVSGEYAMIKAAAAAGYIDEEKVALESLLSMRRAGADVILTYYAKQASMWMAEPEGFWQQKLQGKL